MCESEYQVVDVERTESMQRLSTALCSALDSALQVNQTLHDVTSRAARLDVTFDVTLDVIRDSSRLAELLQALSMSHDQGSRYARWLWTAARNLVREVIGHVITSSHDDFQGQLKVNDKDERRQTVRRAAAQLELFYAEPIHADCMAFSYVLPLLSAHCRHNCVTVLLTLSFLS